jgi:hypothetical protein
MGEKRNAYKMFVRKPREKKPPRRPRHTWEDNIKKYNKHQMFFIHVLHYIPFTNFAYILKAISTKRNISLS